MESVDIISAVVVATVSVGAIYGGFQFGCILGDYLRNGGSRLDP